MLGNRWTAWLGGAASLTVVAAFVVQMKWQPTLRSVHDRDMARLEARQVEMDRTLSCTECVRKCRDTCQLNGIPIDQCICDCRLECGT